MDQQLRENCPPCARMKTRRAREIERRRQPLRPTDSGARKRGRVLILAADARYGPRLQNDIRIHA
jgi:hypothetical protein